MARTKGSRDLFQRLIDGADVGGPDDCWEWKLSKNNVGYGFMRDQDKMRTAHKVSYELHNNVKVKQGEYVCHTCTTKTCINPNHLIIGTRQDITNTIMARGTQRFWGSTATHPARLGKKQPTAICVYCGKTCATHLLNRWHNDNCKHKV